MAQSRSIPHERCCRGLPCSVLGLSFIPAVTFSYDQVEFQAWREGYEVSPAHLRSSGEAIAHDLYPPKTTRHVFLEALATCLIPLARLRPEDGFGEHAEWVWDGKIPPQLPIAGARYAKTFREPLKVAA